MRVNWFTMPCGTCGGGFTTRTTQHHDIPPWPDASRIRPLCVLISEWYTVGFPAERLGVSVLRVALLVKRVLLLAVLFLHAGVRASLGEVLGVRRVALRIWRLHSSGSDAQSLRAMASSLQAAFDETDEEGDAMDGDKVDEKEKGDVMHVDQVDENEERGSNIAAEVNMKLAEAAERRRQQGQQHGVMTALD